VFRKAIFFMLFAFVLMPVSRGTVLDQKMLSGVGAKVCTGVERGIQRYAQAFTKPHAMTDMIDAAIYAGTALIAAAIIYKIYKHFKHTLAIEVVSTQTSEKPAVDTVVNTFPVENEIVIPIVEQHHWHAVPCYPTQTVTVEEHHNYWPVHQTSNFYSTQKQQTYVDNTSQQTYERTTQSIIEQTSLTPNIEQKAAEFGKIKLPSIFEK